MLDKGKYFVASINYYALFRILLYEIRTPLLKSWNDVHP